MLVERIADEKSTVVLVDTSPDMREQLISTQTKHIDAVLFTHDHADQTHGIDDLRMVAINMRQRIPIYADKATFETLNVRFGYCFQTPPGSEYPPILDARPISLPKAISIDGGGGSVEAIPFDQEHGRIRSLGFRFGPVAYSSDVNALPDESFEALEGIDCWIVDALRYTAHPTHANVETALSWIERVKPKKAYLTNMHVDLDYQTLKAELPAHVEPAYDGMTIEFPA